MSLLHGIQFKLTSAVPTQPGTKGGSLTESIRESPFSKGELLGGNRKKLLWNVSSP